MAEARREEAEEDIRDMHDMRNRRQATDRPERTKPDHLLSSQGPLSSIRAAIKRTRTLSQGDLCRERRRPQITIVSAEPLASNAWFPGASGVFPPPPLPSQPAWSGTISTAAQLPPSYDQVIKEKTQEEHVPPPIAAPRRSACTTTSTTTTIATQTDPVTEDSAPAQQPQTVAVQPPGKRTAGKKPQKPPRPSLPKPLQKSPAIKTPEEQQVSAHSATTFRNSEDESDSKSAVERSTSSKPSLLIETDRSPSVIVYWETQRDPSEHSSTTGSPSTPADPTAPPTDPLPAERPVPRPRVKSRKQPATEDLHLQSLIRLSESGDDVCTASSTDQDLMSSNTYFQELLEVFGEDSQRKACENASSEMSGPHSQQNNFQARIKAFESRTGNDEGTDGEPAKRPEPLPRNRPPVAATPSRVPKQLTQNNSVENGPEVTTQNPTPAPRPQPPVKPVGLKPALSESENVPSKAALLPPSRASVLKRAKCFDVPDEGFPMGPPMPPPKPSKEPLKANLNLNNHNSTSTENVYMNGSAKQPAVKPQFSVDRPSITRRPTTIRVPSTATQESWDSPPPPLPSQKPVGSLPPSLSRNPSLVRVLPTQASFNTEPEPSLPPRPTGGRSLPPRPTPAKAGPGRPPPPRAESTGQSLSRAGVEWEPTPKPKTPAPAQKPKRKGPALPPRPNPGHRLYNKYMLEQPHGIALFDFNGSHTGELSFQKNEVLLLLDEIDHRTFECKVGDTRGKVQKSHMTVITPLSSASATPPQDTSMVGPARDACGLQVQALHDFTPEGPGELGLRAGDVVTMVEQVDSDWYRGTCRGSAGFFPVNYVQVLSNSPKPVPEKKPKPSATIVRGPRCMARFDFDGEHADELTFTEGDVIELIEYIGEEWARGKVGASTGIFPLNFVEVIEDLPPPPPAKQTQATKIALPGLAASTSPQPGAAQANQPPPSGVEWAVALYSFTGQAEGDLSFQQGDRILITQHHDADWCSGRLNGREGMFPKAFVETPAGQSSVLDQQQSRTAKALFDFTSDCEEELSLQVGDIITNVESVDEEWFLGDLRGKRALVPKNYVQFLE